MKKMNKVMNKIYRYFKRTYKNKLVAIAVFMLAILPLFVSKDCLGFTIFMGIFYLPLFFAKENEIR